MRDRTRAVLQDSTDDGSSQANLRSQTSYEISATYLEYHRADNRFSVADLQVSAADLRVSAMKILYTYILPRGERVLALPNGITDTLVQEIEMDGRHDPEVFDAAKGYVFQVMERYDFPGFINLGRPLFRVFRRSKNLAPLVNRLVLGGAFSATRLDIVSQQLIRPPPKPPSERGTVRQQVLLPPEELCSDLDDI